MGEFDQVPKTRSQPTKHDAPAHTKPPPKKHDDGVAVFDPIQMSAMLLRNAIELIYAAVDDKTRQRKTRLAGAVGTFATAAVTVAKTPPSKPVPTDVLEIAAAFSMAGQWLANALRDERLTEHAGELAEHQHRLATTVPGFSSEELRPVTRGTRPSAKPLDHSDRITLFQNALAGARLGISAVSNAKESPHAQLVAMCIPIPGRIDIATDAALAITNRGERRKLTADVEQVSGLLDGVAQILAMPPRHPWNVTFARVFDAENQLRRALGLGSKGRPYSGRIDPDAAVAALKAAGNGKPKDFTRHAAVDPQTAVTTIAIGVRHTFEQQEAAVRGAEDVLREPPPPKGTSAFDTLLGIATNLAIGGVAGMLAGAVAHKLKVLLEKSAGTRATRLVDEMVIITDGVDKAARDAQREGIIDQMVKDGALHRAVAVDGVKDTVKTAFKESVAAALKNRPQAGPMLPLSRFLADQRAVLSIAKQNAELEVAHSGPALVQLDLETLNELSSFINGELVGRAGGLQYDATMREWQNFKVRLEGVDPSDNRPAHPYEWADGALSVKFALQENDPLGHSTPLSMKLRGGERGAIEHLKNAKRPLESLGMFADLHPVIEGRDRIALLLALKPDFTLQKPDPRVTMPVLRLIAAKQPLTEDNIERAFAGHFDLIPETSAIAVGQRIAKNIAWMTTIWLEDR